MSGTGLTLEEARAILARAVEKSLEIQWISSYAVVDENGNVVSISRVDGAPPSAAASARAKAYLAAVTGRTTLPFARRIVEHPVRFAGYLDVLGRPMFPGPGAMPIVKDGRVVGGFGSNISSAPGGMQIEIDGRRWSRADIVTAYALQIPYDEQHADVP